MNGGEFRLRCSSNIVEWADYMIDTYPCIVIIKPTAPTIPPLVIDEVIWCEEQLGPGVYAFKAGGIWRSGGVSRWDFGVDRIGALFGFDAERVAVEFKLRFG